MTSPLRLGWIGCGTHANEMLLPQVTRHDVVLQAICDISQESLATTGRRYGVATENRRKGYRRAMARVGLAPWEVEVPFGSGAGREAAEALLASDFMPTGVFCASDELAAEMMSVFRQAGVTAPGDLSIVGVDDHPIAGMMGLTTIAQPAREQGRVAATLALGLLRREPVSECVVLPTRLVVRDTTRRVLSDA